MKICAPHAFTPTVRPEERYQTPSEVHDSMSQTAPSTRTRCAHSRGGSVVGNSTEQLSDGELVTRRCGRISHHDVAPALERCSVHGLFNAPTHTDPRHATVPARC